VRAFAVLWSVGVLIGCAPDLRVDHPFDGQTTTGPLVTMEQLVGGERQLSIDATNKSSQVYVDLDEGREMKPDEAFATNGWELAFRRFDVSVNSGSSNPDGVVEVVVLGADYEALNQAPASGFIKDTNDRVFNSVDGGWYVYDLSVHRLLTRPELTYVIKSSQGAYFKLKMLSYYDTQGTPAALSLKYAPLAFP
jgi:hypothetical protein